MSCKMVGVQHRVDAKVGSDRYGCGMVLWAGVWVSCNIGMGYVMKLGCGVL